MSRAAGAGAAPRAAMAAGGAATFALVVLLGLATPVPAEDGVSYFWMAQQFAAGAFAEALAMVFPPGWPLLLAPIVALGVSPEAAALLLSALTLALAAGPLVALAHELDPRAAWPAALLWASSPLLLRVAAEGYSEPPFVLLVAVGTWFGRRERFVAAGVCAGLAFWVRPEGLVLAASFVFVAPRAAWRALLPAGLCVLALATLRAALGLGSELLPLLTFHEQRDDLPGRGRVLANVLELPGPWFEAFGIAAAAALLAPWRGQPVLAKVLRWQIALQVAAICTFVVRRRFFLSCAVPVVALAALAIARLRGRWRTAALGAAVASGLAFAWNGRIDADRAVDRDLGVWLRPQSGPAAAVCSELPRVTWFAGARPGLPRRFTPAQWLEQAAPPEVRWLVLAERTRAEFTAAEVAALERRFRPAAMPQSLQGAVEGRRIFVFERR